MSFSHELEDSFFFFLFAQMIIFIITILNDCAFVEINAFPFVVAFVVRKCYERGQNLYANNFDTMIRSVPDNQR